VWLCRCRRRFARRGAAIEFLPSQPVTQAEEPQYKTEWSPDAADGNDDEDGESSTLSFVLLILARE